MGHPLEVARLHEGDRQDRVRPQNKLIKNILDIVFIKNRYLKFKDAFYSFLTKTPLL